MALFLSAAPAQATLYIQLQYGSQLPVIVSTSNTSTIGFSGTFGVAGTGCIAAQSNCFFLNIVGIDAASPTDPGFVSFNFNGAVANVTTPGTITIYVQQTGVSPYVGQLASGFSTAQMGGSAQHADLYTFLNTSQLATQSFTGNGTATTVNNVNMPTTFSEALVYIYTFGQGAGTFGGGASLTAVPEPATWAMMLVGFGAMGGTLRYRRKIATRVRFA